ncbi:MAG: hypothetical protein C0490_00750 [Marivirga sp.]|nr:hypothetical protein [Marivirga sp.]
MTEEEMLMQEAMDSSSFFSDKAQVPMPEVKMTAVMEAEDNKGLAPEKIRNFWFTRNSETIRDFGRHSELNAQGYYKKFSSPGLNDPYHAGMAETCAYRNMIDTHKKELADPSMEDTGNLEKKHECEIKLFDVELAKMKGQEPDVSEVEQAYSEYESSKPAPQRERKPLATPQFRPQVERQPAQVKHRDANELETMLKVSTSMNKFKNGNAIAAMRRKFGEQ